MSINPFDDGSDDGNGRFFVGVEGHPANLRGRLNPGLGR